LHAVCREAQIGLKQPASQQPVTAPKTRVPCGLSPFTLLLFESDSHCKKSNHSSWHYRQKLLSESLTLGFRKRQDYTTTEQHRRLPVYQSVPLAQVPARRHLSQRSGWRAPVMLTTELHLSNTKKVNSMDYTTREEEIPVVKHGLETQKDSWNNAKDAKSEASGLMYPYALNPVLALKLSDLSSVSQPMPWRWGEHSSPWESEVKTFRLWPDTALSYVMYLAKCCKSQIWEYPKGERCITLCLLGYVIMNFLL
jgi:hypothetical protein